MFENKQDGQIPGYTGHKRALEEHDANNYGGEARKHIPGYQGYVSGIKSEKVYGQTFGKTSFASNAKQIHRGIDHPNNVKYCTSTKAEYRDHAKETHETVATSVGVHRDQDTYKKPIPPQTKHAFYGIDSKDQNETVAQSSFEANQRAFFSHGEEEQPHRAQPEQTEEQAM